MIYFIQCNAEDRPIKIGHTRFLPSRLKSMRVSNPFELTVLATIPGNPALERAIQAKFSDLHIQGEWYRAGTELIEFVGRIERGEEVELPKYRVITPRKKQMVRMWLRGLSQAEIARKLGISRQAVHDQLGSPRSKRAYAHWKRNSWLTEEQS